MIDARAIHEELTVALVYMIVDRTFYGRFIS